MPKPKANRKSAERPPRCVIIAGPNGAGKSTFAREFLPKATLPTESLAVRAGRALRRAAKSARKTARNHGTPIAIERDGKIVTLNP